MHPSIDFFGLTLLNLCFPNLFPIKYANISVPHAAIIAYHTSIIPCSAPLNNAINSILPITYIIPKSVYAISLKFIFIFVIITCANNIKFINGIAINNIILFVCSGTFSGKICTNAIAIHDK